MKLKAAIRKENDRREALERNISKGKQEEAKDRSQALWQTFVSVWETRTGEPRITKNRATWRISAPSSGYFAGLELTSCSTSCRTCVAEMYGSELILELPSHMRELTTARALSTWLELRDVKCNASTSDPDQARAATVMSSVRAEIRGIALALAKELEEEQAARLHSLEDFSLHVATLLREESFFPPVVRLALLGDSEGVGAQIRDILAKSREC